MRKSVTAIRDDISDLFARLGESEAFAATRLSRTKYLLLVFGFLRRLLELHLEFVDDPARRFGAPDARRDTHPDRPAAQHHGERHVTGSEPESGDRLSARIGAALDGITGEAIGAVGNLVASSAAGAAYGIDAVAEQLGEQQVAVLLVAADLARHGDGASYRIGRRPTEFIVGDSDAGTEVPLEDGLVWTALHQDAIVVQLPDRPGPLAGQPVAALLRR